MAETKQCLAEHTMEDMVADGARSPWIWLSEDIAKLGIHAGEFSGYKDMAQDPRIRALIGERHSGNFSARHRQQEVDEFHGLTPDKLRGFLEYGLEVKPKHFLGAKSELFAYQCGHCDSLVVGAPIIQTVTGRNNPIERGLSGRAPYWGIQGVIYACSHCNKDMLVEVYHDSTCVD